MSAITSAVGQSFAITSLDRRIRLLRTATGPLIAAALEVAPKILCEAACLLKITVVFI